METKVELRQYSRAAELLVRANLLLIGEYPLAYDVDNDADICLDSGIRIQVKSSLSKKCDDWTFNLARGAKRRKTANFSILDFIVCVGFIDLTLPPRYWIIPSSIFKKESTIHIYKTPKSSEKYNKYFNA